MSVRPLRDYFSWLSPTVVLVVTCALAGYFKGHCGGWHDDVQYTTGCYSDAVPFWGLRGVAAGEAPYFQARLEYPVLTGGLIWIEGALTRLIGGTGATATQFLAVVVAANALLTFAVLEMMTRAGVSLSRRYAWAAGPPLVLYLGHNWDMLAVTLALGAMLAARRGAAVRATALAALGTAAKLFPVLLLPLLGLSALFAPQRGSVADRVAAAARLVAVALLAWGAVNLPVALLAQRNWREFYTFSGTRDGTAAATWEVLSVQGWWVSTLAARNLASAIAFLAGATAIVASGWRRHGDRAWLLFTPVLAWFLLTSKVWSPQFDLWLYPMLLLTSRRLWPVAVFVVGDIAAYFAEFWWFAGNDGYHPSATTRDIAIAAAIRAAALLWIIGAAVRGPAPDWVGEQRGGRQARATPPRASPPRADRPTPAG